MSSYESVLNGLKRKGYRAELFIASSSSISLETDHTLAITPMEKTMVGYGLRVLMDGRLGFASSNAFTKDLAGRAIEVARHAEKDSNNVIASQDGKNGVVNDSKFKIDDARSKMGDVLRELIDVKGMQILGAGVDASVGTVRVINTEGVNVSESGSEFSAGLAANYRSGAVATPSLFEGDASTELKLSVAEMKSKLARKIEILKSATKSTGKYDEVVLTPSAAGNIISTLFSSAINGENRSRGMTPLSEGMDIGNPKLSVIDDPTLPDAMGSSVFDSEGLRKRAVHLIRDGKVENFLYDSYWANKAGRPSTHSAERAYTSTPGIAPSNIVIKAPEQKNVAVDVLVVDSVQGVHTSDLTTGSFSVTASVAWLNKGGSDIGQKGVLISGSIADLLRGIQTMSSEKKERSGVITGDLRIKGLSVG